MSVRSHTSKTTCPNFTEFSVGLCVNCNRGSVLLGRQYNMLCTSSFVDEVMFVYVCQAKATPIRHLLKATHWGRIGDEVWCLRVACSFCDESLTLNSCNHWLWQLSVSRCTVCGLRHSTHTHSIWDHTQSCKRWSASCKASTASVDFLELVNRQSPSVCFIVGSEAPQMQVGSEDWRKRTRFAAQRPWPVMKKMIQGWSQSKRYNGISDKWKIDDVCRGPPSTPPWTRWRNFPWVIC